MAMGRNNGLVDVVDVLHKVFNLGSVLLGQAIASGIRNVNHRSSSLYNSLDNTCKVFVVCTTGIFGIELHVLYITLGVFHSTHGTLNNLLAIGMELILYVRVGCSDSSMYSATFCIFQRLGGTVNIFLHGASQGTNGRPCNSL